MRVISIVCLPVQWREHCESSQTKNYEAHFYYTFLFIYFFILDI